MLDRRRFLAVAAAWIPTIACSRKGSGGYSGHAYVANENARQIAIVDLNAFRVATHLPLDEAATEVIAHPSRPRVFALAPKAGLLYEIDSAALRIVRKTELSKNGATTMHLGMDGESVWALCANDRKLVNIRIEDGKRAGSLNVGPNASSFELARDWTGAGQYTDRAAVCYRGEGSFSLADLKQMRAGRMIRVADTLGPIRFLSNGKSLLMANPGHSMLTVAESTQGRTITNLQLAVRPDNLCFNRDGGQLFVTGEGRDAVVVIYPYFVPQVAETVLAGHSPGAMAASDRFLFVANPEAGDVSILDIARRKVVAVSSVGSEPAHITITPDDRYALVLNRMSGDMAVIRIASIVPDRRKAAALFTMIRVGSRPVSAAVKELA